MSLIYIINNRGPKIEHFGTPVDTPVCVELVLLNAHPVLYLISSCQVSISLIADPFIP